MVDAEDLARAYDMGFAAAEDSVKYFGEKRWPDIGWAGSEEELDSYWAGYEDYQPGIVIEEKSIEQ